MANNPGIEKLVWKQSDNGGTDIDISGDHISTDTTLTLYEKLMSVNAKGGQSKTGNKRTAFEMQISDAATRDSIEADEGSPAPLEVWFLGSTAADETISNVDLHVLREEHSGDPEAEDYFPYVVAVRAINAA